MKHKFFLHRIFISFLSYVLVFNHFNYVTYARMDFTTWLLDTNGIVESENNKLSFNDCGGQKSSIHIQKMNVVPKVFKFPQNVSVTATLEILSDIEEPIQTEIVMRKDLPYVGFVELPCLKGFGSCMYNNICEMLVLGRKNANHVQKNSTNACAWVKSFGLPCFCPLRKGVYRADKTNLPLAGSLLPQWVEKGRYEVDLRILKNHRSLGCFMLSFTIL